jgi:hypothetical protein
MYLKISENCKFRFCNPFFDFENHSSSDVLSLPIKDPYTQLSNIDVLFEKENHPTQLPTQIHPLQMGGT